MKLINVDRNVLYDKYIYRNKISYIYYNIIIYYNLL